MKKLTLILSLMVMVFITSCQKDDDCDTCGTAIDNASGEWKVAGVQYDLSGQVAVTDCFKKGTFNLKSDGTFSRTTYTNEDNCVIDNERTGNGRYEFIESAKFDLYYEGRSEPVRVDLIVRSGGLLEIVERPSDNLSSFVAIYHYER